MVSRAPAHICRAPARGPERCVHTYRRRRRGIARVPQVMARWSQNRIRHGVRPDDRVARTIVWGQRVRGAPVMGVHRTRFFVNRRGGRHGPAKRVRRVRRGGGAAAHQPVLAPASRRERRAQNVGRPPRPPATLDPNRRFGGVAVAAPDRAGGGADGGLTRAPTSVTSSARRFDSRTRDADCRPPGRQHRNRQRRGNQYPGGTILAPRAPIAGVS